MRKIYLVWLLAGMFVLTSTLIASAEKVTIDYWIQHGGSPTHTPIAAKLINEFNRTHPDIKVNSLRITETIAGDPSEKLIIAIAGGTPPDVADLAPDRLVEWVIKGATQPITEFVEKAGIDLEGDYFGFAIEPLVYKGEVYELPLHSDARALYYNKKLFREAGLDPNKPPKTITELDEYAEKLTVKDSAGRYKVIGFIPWYGCVFLLNYGWRWGGEIYDPEANKVTINEEPYVRALTWMNSYAEKYGATEMRSFSTAFGSGTMHPFIIDKLGMIADGNWSLGTYQKYAPNLDYDVAPFPPGPGGKVTTWASGWAIFIPKGSEHPEEAFEFMKWISGPDYQTTFCLEGGMFPSNKEVAADPRFREGFGGRQAVFMDLLAVATAYPPKDFAAPMLLWDEMIAARDYVLEGMKTPKEALDDVAEKVNAAIAPYPPG